MRRARVLIARVAGVAVLAAAPVGTVSPLAVGAGAAAIVVTVEAAHPQTAAADNLWLHSCSFYGTDIHQGSLWSPQYAYNSTEGWTNDDRCGSPGDGFGLSTNAGVWGTHWEQWGISSPAGIEIDSAWTPPCYWDDNCQFASWHGTLVECGSNSLASQGYSAWYVWGAGAGQTQITNNDGGNCYSDGLADGTPINQSIPATNFFGFQLRCDKPSNELCGQTGNPAVALTGIQLGATETAVPSIDAAGSDNLSRSGWVRGDGWKIGFSGSDPSGLCNMRAWLNGQLIQGPTDTSPDQSVWDQCDPSGDPQAWADPNTVDTTQYADGTTLQLIYQAVDAAGNSSPNLTTTSYVDNSPVTLALAGPREASIGAGTQYVTATSSANPSGDTIWCQTDGGPWTAYMGTSARIPVSGLGDHRVSCLSEDSAVDTTGNDARSTTETWSLRIGEPVHSDITFGRVSRTCRRVRVRKHHHTAHVLRCHTVTRALRTEYLGYGRRATVRGWFATVDGAALGHVRVKLLAALDNGLRHWRTVDTVSTAADGSWKATLPAGPSRLIEAVYGGGPMIVSAASPIAKLEVHASSTLGLTPVVHFGHLAYFAGRLLGGHVPRTGAIVVVEAFDRGQWRNIATVRTDRRGNWSARYAIDGGAGAYPIRVRIPRQASYPWAEGFTPVKTLVVHP